MKNYKNFINEKLDVRTSMKKFNVPEEDNEIYQFEKYVKKFQNLKDAINPLRKNFDEYTKQLKEITDTEPKADSKAISNKINKMFIDVWMKMRILSEQLSDVRLLPINLYEDSNNKDFKLIFLNEEDIDFNKKLQQYLFSLSNKYLKVNLNDENIEISEEDYLKYKENYLQLVDALYIPLFKRLTQLAKTEKQLTELEKDEEKLAKSVVNAEDKEKEKIEKIIK